MTFDNKISMYYGKSQLTTCHFKKKKNCRHLTPACIEFFKGMTIWEYLYACINC